MFPEGKSCIFNRVRKTWQKSKKRIKSSRTFYDDKMTLAFRSDNCLFYGSQGTVTKWGPACYSVLHVWSRICHQFIAGFPHIPSQPPSSEYQIFGPSQYPKETSSWGVGMD